MTTPVRPVLSRTADPTETATSGRALGLNVEAPFGFPGLRGASGASDDRWVHLDLVSPADLESAWPGDPLAHEQHPVTKSSSGVITHHDPDAGYLIAAPDGRHCLVDSDGHRIRIADTADAGEHWQGLVAAQALPLAAILQGLEVLEVSAVVVAGEVMAFAGPAGVGKSGLAARLMLVGARFFADDAVALEVRDGQIVAHAGLGLVRLGARARFAVPQLAAQGADVIGRDGKTLVDCPRDVPTLPLRSLYVLSPVSAQASPQIAPMRPEPSRLLASTHSVSVRTPERLRRHFELMALLGTRVGIFNARVPLGGEHDLARAIFTHAALEVLL